MTRSVIQRCWSIAAAVVLTVSVVAAAPAMAADSTLDLARKALKAGKTDLVLRAINAALAGGSLKGGDIAKAYFVRGLANAKAGNQAAALSDLNNALYLKGLSEAERKDAEVAKSAAYRTAGVAASPAAAATAPKVAKLTAKSEPVATPAAAQTTATAEPLPWKGGAETAAAPVQVQAPVPAPTPAPVVVAAATPEPPPAPLPKPVAAPEPQTAQVASNPFSTMLGGLFGGDQPAAEPVVAAPQPIEDATKTVTVAAAETAEEPAPAWKTTPQTAKRAKLPAAAKAVASKQGGIYLQVASLRTTGEADALAAKLGSEHAATIGVIVPTVAPVVLGNMGTFYAVRLGPIASKGAGTSLCNKLRKEGVDCYFATP